MIVDFGGPSVLIMGIIVLMAVFFFLYLLIKPHIIAKKTNCINEGFVCRTGGKFDEINWTYPFVKIIVLDSKIKIYYEEVELNVNYDQIIAIELYNGIISEGFLIKHNLLNIPQEIIIWTPCSKQIIYYIKTKINIDKTT